MAYHVYHTEALILGGRAHGDGDRVLYCYTREFGLIYAHAKSVREVRSRLRYTLQTFGHIELDLIRGKHGWKLISARPVTSFASLWQDKEKRIVVAQHAHLLRRMIQGEEEYVALFDDVLAGLHFLTRIQGVRNLRALELVLVIRMLAHLGYWKGGEHDQLLLGDDAWTHHTLTVAEHLRPLFLVGINEALAASQL